MSNTLLNVELFKEGVQAKLEGKTKLHQFVETENAENLQVGTFNIVTNDYVGDATVVEAGAKIPLTDLVQKKTPVTFEKIAKGVRVTDEEMRQTFGDPVGNAEKQTVASISGKMEAKISDLFEQAKFSVNYTAGTPIDSNAVLTAITVMGEAIEDAPYFVVVNPVDFGNLQRDLKSSDNTALQGLAYGAGIIMSSRVKAGNAILIQKGAIAEIVQKDVDVELQRDASTKSTEIYTDKIHAVYIKDQSKLVVIKEEA